MNTFRPQNRDIGWVVVFCWSGCICSCAVVFKRKFKALEVTGRHLRNTLATSVVKNIGTYGCRAPGHGQVARSRLCGFDAELGELCTSISRGGCACRKPVQLWTNSANSVQANVKLSNPSVSRSRWMCVLQRSAKYKQARQL